MKNKVLALLCFFLICAFANAEISVFCPAVIKNSIGNPPVHEGWIIKTDEESAMLLGMALFDGPSSEIATLKPDVIDKYNGSWQIINYEVGSHARPLVIQCLYSHSPFVLEREVPRGVNFCGYSRDERGVSTSGCTSTGSLKKD